MKLQPLAHNGSIYRKDKALTVLVLFPVRLFRLWHTDENPDAHMCEWPSPLPGRPHICFALDPCVASAVLSYHPFKGVYEEQTFY